jgi:hypothetical protein
VCADELGKDIATPSENISDRLTTKESQHE